MIVSVGVLFRCVLSFWRVVSRFLVLCFLTWKYHLEIVVVSSCTVSRPVLPDIILNPKRMAFSEVCS